MRALTCAALTFALFAPAAAQAAAPSLQSPGAGTSVTEGTTVNYEWSGELQGAESARDQAYFVVEVIEASKAPAGQQSAWTDADTSKVTTAGAEVTSVELGAPPAGSWKWRVCAWGVVDPAASVTVEPIPGGCSGARSLTSTAAAISTSGGDVEVIDETRRVTVENAPTVVEKVRPTTPAKATPDTTVATTNPAGDSEDEDAGSDVFQPIKVEKRAKDATTTSGGAKQSSVALGTSSVIGDAAESDVAAARTDGGRKLGGALASGLSASLPGIPIPFWVLLFLIACVPIAFLWRRSVLAMFEWSDGSIDGFGTPDLRTAPVLAHVQPDRDTHAFGGAADDAATASASKNEVPGLQRAA